MAPSSSRRGLATAVSSVAALMAALLAVALLPGSAQATPRPSLQQVQRQVDALRQQAGDAAERYNDAKVRLAAANRRLAVVRHRLVAQEASIRSMQGEVGRLASASYRSGGLDSTLQILLADDPTSFLQSAAALSQLGRQQSDALLRVVQARQGLSAARHAAATQRARSAAINAEIADEKGSVEAKLDKATSLLGTLRADQRARLAAAARAVATRGRSVASRTRQADLPRPSYEGPASGRAATAIRTAFAQLGDPYVFGAAGPGAFDCSGLTMFAWGSAGVSLPHSSAAQFSSGRHVSESDLQPGDLVFYYSPISHVGMYVGGGRIIHAPHPGRSVEVVGLHMMPFVGAVRP